MCSLVLIASGGMSELGDTVLGLGLMDDYSRGWTGASLLFCI